MINEANNDEHIALRHGLPPEIDIPLNKNNIEVQLIHGTNAASRMVAYQVRVDDVVVASHKLYHPFKLGGFKLGEIEVSCEQLSCHIANDNKQVTILASQCSCLVKYPMPCCMVSKSNLGVAPVWIQW